MLIKMCTLKTTLVMPPMEMEMWLKGEESVLCHTIIMDLPSSSEGSGSRHLAEGISKKSAERESCPLWIAHSET